MILRYFPDHTRPDFNLDAPCPVFGWPNMIIHASTTDVEYPEHDGALSLKCAFGGPEVYRTGGEQFVVNDGCYLILNRGSRYSSFIHSDTAVETFCIFFQADFAGDVLRSLATPTDALLDDPSREEPGTIRFVEQIYRHDDLLTPLILRLRAASAAGKLTTEDLEENMHHLLENMLIVHRNVRSEIERVPSVRHSTRIEIHRRLHQARIFIDDNIGAQITLNDVAAVACLSPHHFLRLFRETFGETPHQYLTRRRIERAQHLLLHTKSAVAEICVSVGFQSPGSFSWLFRRHIGLSPDAYRGKHGKGSHRASRREE